jgi:putative membrane protein
MTMVDANEMARSRTAMAADRTLMAWVRTALSMISFGFTIAKFFQYLAESGKPLHNQNAPRNMGAALVLLGVGGVIAAVLQHRHTLRELGLDRPAAQWSVTVITALAIAAIGAVVFVSALTDSGPF